MLLVSQQGATPAPFIDSGTPALWDDMVLSASPDIIALGLKGPWKSGFYVHQVSKGVIPRVILQAAYDYLQLCFQRCRLLVINVHD